MESDSTTRVIRAKQVPPQYIQGVKMPGCIEVFLNTEAEPRIFPEGYSILRAKAELEAEGIICANMRFAH